MRELKNIFNQVISESDAVDMVLITLGDDMGLYCDAVDARIITGGSFVGETVYCDECCEIDGELYFTDDCDFVAFDEINGVYILESDAVSVFHRGGDKYITSYYNEFIFEYGGDYYSDIGADYYGIYYCDECCDYYCDICENCCDAKNENVFDYHDIERQDHSNDLTVYKIGLEIEKDDERIKQGLDSDDKYNLLDDYGIILERDGSLSDDGGFEIVTPCYNFTTKTAVFKSNLINAFIYNDKLNGLINAKTDSGCGFHLNISKRGYNDKKLLKQFKPLLPLLYTLYSVREFNTYSKFKSYLALLKDAKKFQAIRLKGDYLELRLFPRVINLDQLIFRLELMRILLIYTDKGLKYDSDIIKKLKNKKTMLNKHLNKVLKVDSNFIKRVKNMSLKYSDKKIVKSERVAV